MFVVHCVVCTKVQDERLKETDVGRIDGRREASFWGFQDSDPQARQNHLQAIFENDAHNVACTPPPHVLLVLDLRYAEVQQLYVMD